MTTTLDLWNAALALLPHDRTVASEDEDSTEALRCRQHYDGARRAVLAARDWNWLAEETPACCHPHFTVAGAGYLVERPAGVLRVIGLVDGMGRRIRARAANGGLVALEPAAAVRYLRDEEDPEQWPRAVADAVAAELAARLCPVLTDNPARTAELQRLATARLEEAGMQDAQETAYGGGDPLRFAHARE